LPGAFNKGQDATKWFNKGTELLRQTDFVEALKCFDEAIRMNPRWAEAWLNRGFAVRGLGRFEEVLECFKKATEIDPGYAEAWLNRGFALRGLGRYDEALDCFDKAIENDPTNADALAQKGFTLDKLNRIPEAAASYDEALKLNPNDSWAKERRKALDKEFGTTKKNTTKKQPSVAITLLETVFKPNLWKQTNLLIKNNSKTLLKNVKVDFLKRVEIGLLREVETLEPGEERKLTFSLKPLESGEVPVDVRVTCKDQSGIEHSASETILLKIIEEKLEEVPTPTTQQTQTIELPMQPRITVDKCIICNLALRKTDEVVRCPSCGNKAHKTHMLEWLHVNKYCPACYSLISEATLEKLSEKESESLAVS
jgi:tetratricopeptide (TPR) repeat protein